MYRLDWLNYGITLGCDFDATTGTVDQFNSRWVYEDRLHYASLPVGMRLNIRPGPTGFYTKFGGELSARIGDSSTLSIVECRSDPREIEGFNEGGSANWLALGNTALGYEWGSATRMFVEVGAGYTFTDVFEIDEESQVIRAPLRLVGISALVGVRL